VPRRTRCRFPRKLWPRGASALDFPRGSRWGGPARAQLDLAARNRAERIRGGEERRPRLAAWKLLVPDGASCSSPFHRRLLPPLVLNVSCLPPCLQLPLPCSSPLSRRLLPYLLLCFPLPCRLCSSPPEGPPAGAAPPRLGSSTRRRCSSKPGKLRRPHCSSNLLPAALLQPPSLQGPHRRRPHPAPRSVPSPAPRLTEYYVVGGKCCS